jgi:hypothetical protein
MSYQRSVLLRWHRNELLETIRKSGCDPGLFDGQQRRIGNFDCFVIELRDSVLRFAVRCDPESYKKFYWRQTMIVPTPQFTEERATPCGWGTVLYNLKAWIRLEVRPYLDDVVLPDLWEIKPTEPVLQAAPGEGKDPGPFSEDEEKQIRLSLNGFRNRVAKARAKALDFSQRMRRHKPDHR